MDQPEEKGAVTVELVWRGVDDQPLLYVNQFVVQHQGDELILTIGQLQPPIILGEPNERAEQARRLGHVPVNVVGRFAFTRERLGELTSILVEHLQKFDATKRKRE